MPRFSLPHAAWIGAALLAFAALTSARAADPPTTPAVDAPTTPAPDTPGHSRASANPADPARHSRASGNPADTHLRPAVIIVDPDADRPDDDGTPRVTIVPPRRIAPPQPADSAGDDDYDDDARPRALRPGDPAAFFVRYPWLAPGYPGHYHYGLDPRWPRTWQELHRAQRYERDRDRARRFNERDMARRAQRLLSAHGQALADGVAQLRAGDYRRAVVTLTLASELNQGDPACRIHLAQARLALGHDDEAAAVLRRALQLQPTLAHRDLDLDTYYPDDGTFAAHVDALAARLARPAAQRSAELHFLLGFLEFQRGRYDEAHAALRTAARAAPQDNLTRRLLTTTQPPR